MLSGCECVCVRACVRACVCVRVCVCRHEEEIDRIIRCAMKELELENEFRSIEEHWNEQVSETCAYASQL